MKIIVVLLLVFPYTASEMQQPLETEQRNPKSFAIDTKSTGEILRIINAEDKKIAFAVETSLNQIETLVEDVVSSFKQGGRLFYIGAGTSGRLGVLDASECPPTYGVAPSMVQGIIAGGDKALTTSVEGAEDNGPEGVAALKRVAFSHKDVLIGITASGGAPYVVEAIRYARDLGSKVGAISCNAETPVFSLIEADHRIFLPVGAEVIAGSTRMKAGTAQKLVLNMITTTAMIRMGKVYNNLMVDVKPLNAKLILRSHRLIREISGCSEETARDLFEASGQVTKVAIVMALLSLDKKEACRLLDQNEGSISKIMTNLTRNQGLS